MDKEDCAIVIYPGNDAKWQARDIDYAEGMMRFSVFRDGARWADFQTSLIGDFNVRNWVAVVLAAAQLRGHGITVRVVMTGLPVDHRDRANSNLSSLLQTIAASALNSQITILGRVSYADLVNLMRTAAVIIQPSRFEGWSTVVQDAKALGRPVICSDIAVHREQVPAAIGFFPCDQPDLLSGLLAEHWGNLEPGPNKDLETSALATEREFARRHGETLLKLCEEACE